MPTIDVIVTASAAGFVAGMSVAGKAANSFQGALGRVGSLVTSFGSTLAGVAGAGSFTELVNQQYEHIGALSRTAEMVGATTDRLAGLQLAAKSVGIDVDGANDAFISLSERLADAANGGGEGLEALQRLGLSAADLSKMSLDEALAQISEKMSGVDDASQRVFTAIQLFGDEGAKLTNVLAGGSKALDKFHTDAEQLGVAVSEVDAAKIGAANSAWKEFGTLVQGIAQQVAVQLAPFVDYFTTQIVDLGKESGGVASLVATAFQYIGEAIAFVTDLIDVLEVGFVAAQKLIVDGLLSVVDGLDAVGKGIEAVASLFGVSLPDPFKGFREAFIESLENTSAELEDVLNEKLVGPSRGEQVKAFFKEIQDAAQASAEAVTASVEIELPDPSETSDLAKNFGDKAASDPAKKFVDATRTPLEKFEATIAELNDLAAFGLIDEETFSRAVQQAKEDLNSAIPTKDFSDPGPAAALTRGSQETFSAIARRMSGGRDQDKGVRALEELVRLGRAEEERARQDAAKSTQELATVSF